MFPCACDSHAEFIPRVHAIAAAVMYVVLALMCRIFYRRAHEKTQNEKAQIRRRIYLVCGLVLLLSMLTIVANNLSSNALARMVPRLVFYFENAGLVAFGIAWLTASKSLPGLSKGNESVFKKT